MNTFEQYESILKKLEQIQNLNKGFFDQIRSSLELQKAYNLDKSIDAFIRDSTKFNTIYDTLPKLNDIVNSKIFEHARLVTLELSKFSEFSFINEITKQLDRLSDPWQNKLKDLGYPVNTLKEAQLGLQTYFTRINELSLVSELSLAKINWETTDSIFARTPEILESLKNSNLVFSDSYNTLFTSFQYPKVNILTFPPAVISLPPIEFHNNANLCEVLFADKIEPYEEKIVLKSEIDKETEEILEYLLSELDKGLIPMWKGAKQALLSNNSDRARHFCISIRELLTHVLHKLSPDHEVMKWSNIPEHYDEKGKPTRKARFLYICRDINHEPFTHFIKKDIDTTLSFIDLFQKGTHEIETTFKEEQLSLLQTRAEGTIRFLLEIARKSP